MEYMTSLQVAEKWGVSQRRVAYLCAQNRIQGAKKIGKTWLIPSDSEKSARICVSEPMVPYCVKTELMLDPVLVQNAKQYYASLGKTLSDGINDYMKSLDSAYIDDFRSSYPATFFNLFGSVSESDLPDNIDDLIPEDISL